MNIFKRRVDPNRSKELKHLEEQLKFVLQPVVPRQEFVSDLRSRLAARDIQASASRLPQKVSNGLLVAGGVVGSLLMIIASIRGLLSLVGVVGLVIQYFSRNAQRSQAAPAS